MGEVGQDAAGQFDVGGDFGHGGGGGLDVFTEVKEEGCEGCAGLGERQGGHTYRQGVHCVVCFIVLLRRCVLRDVCREMMYRKLLPTI